MPPRKGYELPGARRVFRAWSAHTPSSSRPSAPLPAPPPHHQLRLLSGLSAGHNGLTLNALRVLYPFGLCMELISDPSLPVKLRAAACSLTRQLYVASSARRLRSAKESVWDWDALHKGKLHAACLSLPPRVVRPASEGAKASWAAGG